MVREETKKPLIFDGAMGTYYASIAESPLDKCEMANIYDPNTILKIHRQYISAGCQAIKTNTFGANQASLNCDFDLVAEVIKDGYALARQACAGTEVKVFADIGPIPADEETNLQEEYRKIVDIFLALGAANFLFETFSSDEYLAELSRYIKNRQPQAFIMVSFAISPEGMTRTGKSGRKLLESVFQIPTIDAGGFNCFSGPSHLQEYIKTCDIGNRTVSIMPNSGYPTIINNRTFFQTTKEYFADKMLEIAQQGIAILGGCCGTTPEYIEEMVRRLQAFTPSQIVSQPPSAAFITAPPKPARNLLLDKIETGRKIIAVELDPPVDTDIDFFMNSAKVLKELGVDAITIADCPLARARIDSSLMACKLKRELDITTIPHMTCRDRNINATKALLLGLNVEGINNVLVVTGDPVPTAQRDQIKGIFSFNSAVLAGYISNFNETVFGSPFNICAALNVNSRNFTSQLQRAQKKIDNGVRMFFTQPILSQTALDNLQQARAQLSAKILGGIIPIVSYKNACFMNNEIAGISIADNIVEMYRDLSKEEAGNFAVGISTQMAEKMSPYVDGFYLILPFKRIDLITAIIANIRDF